MISEKRNAKCGKITVEQEGQNVVLCGWVSKRRDHGGLIFVDLRDRYGITQLVFSEDSNAELCAQANELGREFVIQVKGEASLRSNPNKNIPTGDIEILVSEMNVLNKSLTPPFTIEDNNAISSSNSISFFARSSACSCFRSISISATVLGRYTFLTLVCVLGGRRISSVFFRLFEGK